MNTNVVRGFVALLLGLVSFAALSQQSAPARAADASPQGIAEQDTTNVHLKTADGVPACPGESKRNPAPHGVYRVGGSILPPKPMKTPDPTFSDEARKFIKEQHIKNFDATSLVSLIVDTTGMPQDICVVREAGHGLDRKAVDSVGKYRFRPATRDDKPVPVRLMVEVRFQTY